MIPEWGDQPHLNAPRLQSVAEFGGIGSPRFVVIDANRNAFYIVRNTVGERRHPRCASCCPRADAHRVVRAQSIFDAFGDHQPIVALGERRTDNRRTQTATDGDLGGVTITFAGAMPVAAVSIELDQVNTANGFVGEAQNPRFNFGRDAVGANDGVLIVVTRRQVADRRRDQAAIGAGRISSLQAIGLRAAQGKTDTSQGLV